MAAVEEFDLAAQPAVPRLRSRRRGPAGRAVTWVVAALVLVVAGVLAAPTRGALLGSVPRDTVAVLGVDLTAAPDVRWVAEIAVDGARSETVWFVGDTVVAMAADGVHGLDPVTGATVWQAAVDAASCEVGRAVTCVDAPGTPDAAVLRVEDDGRAATVPVPGAVRATDVGADVVVAVADDDAREVRRVARDGTVRWATPVPAEALAKDDLAWWTAVLTVVGGHVHLVTGAPAVSFDVDDGTVEESGLRWVHRAPYGYELSWSDDETAVTLVDADGATLVESLTLAPDDDPGSAVQVRQDLDVAVAARHGEELWRIPSDHLVGRLADVVVVAHWMPSGTRLTGVDQATGRTLWEAWDLPSLAVVGGGSTLVLWDLVGEPQQLHGLDVRTGEVLWTYGEEVSAFTLALLSDGIVVIDGTDVVRLAW